LFGPTTFAVTMLIEAKQKMIGLADIAFSGYWTVEDVDEELI